MIAGIDILVRTIDGRSHRHDNVMRPNDNTRNLVLYDINGNFVRCYGQTFIYWEQWKSSPKAVKLQNPEAGRVYAELSAEQKEHTRKLHNSGFIAKYMNQPVITKA